LWTGNLLDPSSLITLIPLLQIITAQTLERLNLIGNWLYCLRDRLPDINPKPKRAVSAPSRVTRAKRPRADERGRRIARGQLPIAPGREQPPTPQADRAPQSGLSQQATNFKRYVLGLKLIRGNRPFIVGDREKFSILGHQLGDMPQLDPDLRVKEWVREVIS